MITNPQHSGHSESDESSDEGTAASLKDQAVQSVAAMGQRVRDGVKQAGQAIGEQYENVAETTRTSAAQIEQGLETAVKARPLTAIFIAAGVGMAVGFLIGHQAQAKPTKYENLRSLWT